MSKDISSILEGWDYEPDEIQVRIAAGNDGREKIQLRVDLGVLQMELHGRPDGTRPEGFESYLDFYLERQRMHEAAHPDSPSFVLSDEDCLHLWREGVQYYHRYLSLWHLQRYDLCVRDTERNLRLFAFVKQYAAGGPQQAPVRPVASVRHDDPHAHVGRAPGRRGGIRPGPSRD